MAVSYTILFSPYVYILYMHMLERRKQNENKYFINRIFKWY